jgi:hypothetical protein
MILVLPTCISPPIIDVRVYPNRHITTNPQKGYELPPLCTQSLMLSLVEELSTRCQCLPRLNKIHSFVGSQRQQRPAAEIQGKAFERLLQ